MTVVTTDKGRNQLVSEPNYHTTKWFSGNLLTTEVRKTKVKMNKLAYLGLSILDISKTLMHVFWYDYMKPKKMHIKTEDIETEVIGLMKNELGGKIMI